jgi:LacI family transcriptional regulator
MRFSRLDGEEKTNGCESAPASRFDELLERTTGMPNLTLEEIAKQAGVSRSTVSRVINNQPNVREDVRQRIRKVIQATGYHPNLAARSLASQRTSLIGLVIPRSVHTFFTDPYFPRLTQGIAQACNQSNYTLSLFLFNTADDERKLFPRLTRKGLVDGIIIQATNAADELFVQLSQAEVPYVVAGRPTNTGDTSYVDVDNIAGAQNAIRHLIRLGYKRIATIAGPLSTTAGLDRYEGYQRAIQESGMALDERLIVEGDFSEAGGYYAAKQLLVDQPDAIFIASDMMAVGALRAIREAGLSVPGNLGIVGFDDLPPATMSNPALTTVRQPIRRLGIRLVETLLDIIENGPFPPRRIIFDTELVIRESCRINRPVPDATGIPGSVSPLTS